MSGSTLIRVSSRLVYENAWLRVREDTVRRDGRLEPFGVVERAPSVVVIPLSAGGSTLLLRHFRYPTRTYSWEFPGGLVQPGETAEEGARRELREEIGLVPDRLREIGWFYPIPGLTGQRTTIFVAAHADSVLRSRVVVEENEEIAGIRYVDAPSLQRMVISGDITDGITLASLARLLVPSGVSVARNAWKPPRSPSGKHT